MLSDVEILVINNSSKLVSKFKDNFDSNSASETLLLSSVLLLLQPKTKKQAAKNESRITK
jgi:hypothetical protein